MKRILVVDDIAENRYLLEATLQAYGYEVTSANDGAEALACARRHPPDLVISDILMPVMDGFALCRQWRAEEPLRGIPFIFYTATYTDARDEQLAMDVGADRFVIKPQEPQVMQAIIQELLARGAKNLAVPVAVLPQADESVTLREYNEALVRKLEKKVADLEATREALEENIRQRHQVEAALRRSEERWRLIFDTEPECVKVVSAEGTLVDMNPAGLAMIGARSLDEVRSKSVLDLVTPEHREAFLAMHRDVLAGQSRRLVFELLGLNGTRRWLESHEVPLPNVDGTISLLGITRDITERKRAEAALLASEQRFRALIDHSFDAISLVDQDGIFLYGSASATRITGQVSVEYLGKSAFERIHPDDLQHVRNRFAELLSNPEQTQRSQFRFRHKDESWIWLEATATNLLNQPAVQAIVVNYRDITERRRAEEESLRFGRILDDSLNEIYIFDAVSLCFDRVNIGAQLNLGYTMEELRQLTPLDVKPEINRKSFEALVEPLRAGRQRRAVFETVHRRKDGSTYPVEVHLQLANGGESHYFVAITQDISERKRAQDALRESEARYRLLADNTDDFVVLNDTQGNRLYVSPSYFRVTGWTLEELQRTDWRTRMHPDDLPMVERTRAANLAGESTLIEHRIRCKDGSWIWVELRCKPLTGPDGRVSQMLQWSRDITARKRAETALIESEQRFRELFENSRDAIFVEDFAGQVRDVNPAACRLHGLTREQLLSKNARDLVPQNQRAIFDCDFPRLLSGELTQIEGFSLRADGTAVPVELSVSHVVHSGQPSLLLHVRDITARKRAEQAVRDNEARLMGLINATMDAIITIDEEQNVVLFNPAAEKVFQCSRTDVMGKSIHQFVPERFFATHDQQVRQFANSGTSVRQLGERSQVAGRRHDGSQFPAEASILKVPDTNGFHVQVV